LLAEFGSGVDEAKALLDEVVKEDPKNPTAWYNLGCFQEWW